MGIRQVIEGIRDHRSTEPLRVRSVVDPIVAGAAANGTYLWAVDHGLRAISENTEQAEAVFMFGGYGVALAGLVALSVVGVKAARALRNFYQSRINGQPAVAADPAAVPPVLAVPEVPPERVSSLFSYMAPVPWVTTFALLAVLADCGQTAENYAGDATRIGPAFSRDYQCGTETSSLEPSPLETGVQLASADLTPEPLLEVQGTETYALAKLVE